MKYHSKHLGAGLPGRDDAARAAANPAAREMIEHLAEEGIDTLLDRFETQQPQCGYGLRGVCCRMCQWGPCRISERSPLGVCGRSMELIVAANMLRAVAAGTSAQTMHAHEMILTLRAVARGEISLSVQGAERLRQVGQVLCVAMPWTPAAEVAEKVAQAMLDDLGRMADGKMRTFGFSPIERRRAWEQLELMPRSAAFEVLEAMHMTTLGACSDWKAMIHQALRTGLAYAYSGLVTSSVLSDILFGIPEPAVAEINYGILKPDHVNILVHGHSAVMLEKLLEKIASEEIQAFAREKGAAGIVVGGMCCTGHESLARHGVPTVTGAMGQELAIGTGAVDAVVVDMQCVLTGMQSVAECFGTEIVTTCRSNRIPGATHIPFDPEHPATLDEDAERIARLAIETFASRDRSKIHIPQHTTKVMSGFTSETAMNAFGGPKKLLALLREGKIRGVVGMVGCSTPKSAYESGHVEVARELIAQGVLVLTSGCSAHALMSAGLCAIDAAEQAAPGLRAACEEAGVPPVLVMGSCADNARIITIFATLAHQAEEPLPRMPLAVCGPELSNEKTMGQVFAVLAHGIPVGVGMTPQMPIASTSASGDLDGSDPLSAFLCGSGLAEMVGSRLIIEPEPEKLASALLAELDSRRVPGD